MTFNHINLTVNNVQGTRLFLEKYFELKSVEGTQDTDRFIALKDDSGFVISLMEQKETVHYPKSFHLGFLKAGRDKVLDLYHQLKEDHFTVEEPKNYRGRGLDFYFNTPFGFTLQVSE